MDEFSKISRAAANARKRLEEELEDRRNKATKDPRTDEFSKISRAASNARERLEEAMEDPSTPMQEIEVPGFQGGTKTVTVYGDVDPQEFLERHKKRQEFRRKVYSGEFRKRLNYKAGGFVETRGEGKAIRRKKTRML